MKDINEIYKDWCGESHITNSCHPVHDSAQAMDFAEYYHREMSEENIKHIGIIGGAVDIATLRSALGRLETEGVILVSRDNCIVDRAVLESHLETLKAMERPIPETVELMLTAPERISMPFIPKDKLGHKRPYKFHR